MGLLGEECYREQDFADTESPRTCSRDPRDLNHLIRSSCHQKASREEPESTTASTLVA
ncbi:hypothetical protein F3Y22_tig00110332pilonHSYRG01434 [Hibiscus syriacus]|uniref:Uncharacterized protein n=1 Tax=Hibiscus syriacus TaxID=106335 RepID=A0A6A3AZR5_HIBSY|nr:hypothetical protein F3Y22_tig00110332pilonHSYRG01434 [Hibiscus syriacus]